MTDSPDHREPWAIDEKPIPLADTVAAADPADAHARLLVAHGELANQVAADAAASHASRRGLLFDLLGILDALERIAPGHEDPDTADAVASTGRRLARVLRRRGVERVAQVGLAVDSETSDIEDVEVHPDRPAETVVRETVSAYTWNGVVLRRGAVIASVIEGQGATGSVPQS